MPDDERLAGDREDTVAALRALGAALPVGVPAPDLEDAVLARLATEPLPRRRLLRMWPVRRWQGTRWLGARWQGPRWQGARWLGARWLGARRQGARWLGRRWQAAGALLAGAAVVAVAASPAGARVGEWLGIGAVEVVQAPGPTALPPPDPAAVMGEHEVTLAEAARLAPFPLVSSPELGPPVRTLVSEPPGVVSMVWAGPVRLDQMGGVIDYGAVKQYWGELTPTDVDGAEALWMPVPHPVQFRAASGATQAVPPRTAGATLLWERAGVTYRLEGIPELSDAVTVAESLR